MHKEENKIHIRLPEDVHAKLRVRCALERKTIQEFVSTLIQKAVEDIALPVLRTTKRNSKN